jgi:hypothetical protein
MIAAALLASPAAADSGEDGPAFHSSADFGFGWIDDDGFVLILLEQGFSYGGLELVLSGPFRLRVVDQAPADEGTLREQDWDEPSDFARIPRSISFHHQWEDAGLDIRFGELNGIGIGHGSVVDAYYNSTDMDHYQGGLVLSAEGFGNGLEFMLENVIAPEQIAARGFVAPIAWFVDGRWPRRLELGFTFAADMAAPRRIQTTSPRTVPILGGDLSLRLLDKEWGTLAPYLDVMAMDGDAGVHLGVGTSWTLSAERNVLLHLRGEYRYSGSDYHPAVFNPFYEHNRRYYGVDVATGTALTFADHLTYASSAEAHGLMADLTFDWNSAVRLGARYDREGRDRPHWLLFRLDVSPVERFALGFLYGGQDLDGGSGVFARDSLIAASLHARIWGPLRAFAEFSRRWRRVNGSMPFANETGVGVGLIIAY